MSCDVHVCRSKLRGRVRLVPSKSHTMRALLFALLANGQSRIHTPLQSPDTQAMLAAIQMLGARVSYLPDCYQITGTAGALQAPCDIIDCGNSGQVLRFMTAISALQAKPAVITGDHSIRTRRPMASLLGALRQMTVSCTSLSDNEMAPLIINGPAKASQVILDGADSQPVSAILMAATQLPGTTHVIVNPMGEQPWLALTCDWLSRLGLQYHRPIDNEFYISGVQHIDRFNYSVPGDLSAMAFPIVAALITRSTLTIEGVDLADSQGDKAILDICRQMGAEFVYDRHKQTLLVNPAQHLRAVRIDVNVCIDAVPALAVLACFADGTTELLNAAIARHKECDRLAIMTHRLNCMGGQVELLADGLRIQGARLQGCRLHSAHDHRVAMALAVAGLAAEGTTIITDAGCIDKSFPDFVRTLLNVHANMHVNTCELACL